MREKKLYAVGANESYDAHHFRYTIFIRIHVLIRAE